jgi:hypothetical protein
MPGLNASHLGALIDAERADSGWLLPAIARIGTPRAVAFLTEELRRDKDADWPVGFAFPLLGTKGVPVLCDLCRNIPARDERLLDAVATIFGRFQGGAQRLAVQPLLEIARDPRIPIINRQYALVSLGRLGAAAERAVPAMQRLAREDPAAFQQTVDAALLSMNAREAVPGLLRDLQRKNVNATLVFRDLAGLGENGKAAGPEVVRHFGDADWDFRLDAARAAGFIGYRGAIPGLIGFLYSEEDWRLVWAAAQSLGRLRADVATAVLLRVSERHWYPPVREAARVALTHLRTRRPYPVPPPGGDYRFASEFFAYEGIASRSVVPSPPADRAGAKLDVQGGKLVASDNGEWGGELTFVAADGMHRPLLRKNVMALAALGNDIVAVSGLAHLSFNRGDLYRVTQDQRGFWTAYRWRTLPGAPQWAAIRQAGLEPSLRVACLGGTVDVSPDGAMGFVN